VQWSQFFCLLPIARVNDRGQDSHIFSSRLVSSIGDLLHEAPAEWDGR
jgi:hypothetical protein